MEYFSGTHPELISNKIIKKLDNELNVDFVHQPKLTDNISSFYTNFIKPNMFPILIFILFAAFLLLKYAIKQDKKTKRKNKHRDDYENETMEDTTESKSLHYVDIMDPDNENGGIDVMDENENEYTEMPISTGDMIRQSKSDDRRIIDNLAKTIFSS
uniref:Uncharacterized protein n=1 Tax=viral metagenome TaxID=1070528 RepID=A0A6C0EC37_9ZZZZ